MYFKKFYNSISSRYHVIVKQTRTIFDTKKKKKNAVV